MKWISLRKIKLLELSTSTEEIKATIDLNLTDDGLLDLSNNCINLLSLHISGCENSGTLNLSEF